MVMSVSSGIHFIYLSMINIFYSGMVSATTFTLVGVVNKFLTVLLNVVLWDKHSSSTGIFAVCVCLLAGTFYQQAPRRDEIRKDFSEEGVPLVNTNTKKESV